MARKNTPELRIDKRIAYVGGGLIVGEAAAPLAPAIPTSLLAPQNLTVISSQVAASAVTPMAVVNLNWDPPNGTLSPNDYAVQWATDSGFTAPITRQVGGVRSDAAVDGLPTNTLIYFRVAAIYAGDVQGPWSSSVSTTTPSDTTPPAAPTSLVTSWSNITGDLTITWTPPTSTNYRDTRVRVYASNGGALLREAFAAAGRYVWTKGQHYADTSGTYDTSVYLVLTARSWSNVYSATDLTGTATIGAVGTPSGLAHTWSGDAGTAAADLVISWTLGAAAGYRLTLDGTARDVGAVTRYTYTYDTNAAEHSGTADPVVSISLVAIDALGQVSSAATATATNAAPAATTASATGTFAALAIAITASTAADLKDYRIRTYLDGSGTPTDTIYTNSLTYFYEAPSAGSWRVDVAARDRFGQVGTASSLTTAATLESVAEFVENLRARVVYSDSIGTAAASLEDLKDSDLSTNVVTYASSASAYRWTMADRQLVDRHRYTTLATSTTTSTYYYGLSVDGATWTYYSGGTATGGVWSPVAQASEAAAITAAVTLGATSWRIDMPALVEARYFKLFHRNTIGSYALREFLPRSIVEADDIAAEAVTTTKIAAGAVTADRITVSTLSSITANIGSVTAGTITGVTITGGTVQTAASGARAELTSAGLKTYDSAGVVQVEATTSTDGALRAGAGTIYLDSDGLSLESSTSYSVDRGLRFVTGSTVWGNIDATRVAGTSSEINLFAGRSTGLGNESGALNLYSQASGTRPAYTNLYAAWQGGTSQAAVVLESGTATATGNMELLADTITIGNPAGVSITTTGAVAIDGAAASSVSLTNATTNAVDSVLSIVHNSTGTPAAAFGAQIRFGLETTTTANTLAGAVICQWATATHASRAGRIALSAVDSGGAREGLRVEASGSAALLGFYGATAAAKPTVSGSRGGNAALADLLSELATLGLITDSSSA